MSYQLILGDCLEKLRELPDKSVQCIVTSPPYYGLRNYGVDGQIGLEQSPQEYIAKLVEVFSAARRVLKDDGTLFLNLGDSYCSSETASSLLNVQHVNVCDKGDTKQLDCLNHGYLFGSLCDACRVAYLSHISRKGGLLVAMLVASLCETNRERTESQTYHFPTSGYSHQASHTFLSTVGQVLSAHLSTEQARAFLVSTLDESFLPLLDLCLQRRNLSSCLLCAQTLVPCVHQSEHKKIYPYLHHLTSSDTQGLDKSLCNICDTSAIGGASDYRTGDMVFGCSLSYPYCTTKSHHLQLKPKDLMMIPARVAIALQADGWWLRSEICWSKPNPMPESVTDRPTKSHEMIYLLTKSARYFYDNEAVREGLQESTITRNNHSRVVRNGYSQRPELDSASAFQREGRAEPNVSSTGRNLRSVWTVPTTPFRDAHFATFPPKLIEPCIKAGTSEAGECPICGKAWVRVVERVKADGLTWEQRKAIGETSGNRMAWANLGMVSPHLGTSIATTIGFTPQCQCPPHAPIPQTVLDPFNGAGTSGVVALKHGRDYIGIELNPEYLEMSRQRLQNYAIEMPDEIEQPKIIKQQIAMF